MEWTTIDLLESRLQTHQSITDLYRVKNSERITGDSGKLSFGSVFDGLRGLDDGATALMMKKMPRVI